MVAWDAGRTLADRFRAHAGEAPHLYGHAMRAMADDWEAGGPVRRLLAGYEDAPHGLGGPAAAAGRRVPAGADRPGSRAGAVLPLPGGQRRPRRRLAGAAGGDRRARRRSCGRAGDSAADQRGRPVCARCWPGCSTWSARRASARCACSSSAPVPDSICWSTGSASAAPDWQFGPADSPVQFVRCHRGRRPAGAVPVVERRGCDLHPVDATSDVRPAAADLVRLAVRRRTGTSAWPRRCSRGGGASGPGRSSRGRRLAGRAADRTRRRRCADRWSGTRSPSCTGRRPRSRRSTTSGRRTGAAPPGPGGDGVRHRSGCRRRGPSCGRHSGLPATDVRHA